MHLEKMEISCFEELVFLEGWGLLLEFGSPSRGPKKISYCF
jgi:hypothetical protein